MVILFSSSQKDDTTSMDGVRDKLFQILLAHSDALLKQLRCPLTMVSVSSYLLDSSLCAVEKVCFWQATLTHRPTSEIYQHCAECKANRISTCISLCGIKI